MVLLAASLVPLAHPRNLASLKEKFTLIIFSLFHLNWPRIGFCNSIYKNELVFLLPKLTFQHHLHKIHMAFYLLTWTYFKDVIVGRNIINSRLERILFISSDKKKLNKTEKDRKNMEKEKKKRWKWVSENEIPHSNSLKPFEFERNTNIGDINSSSSDNEEECAEAVVWRCYAGGSVGNMFLGISQNSQKNTCARASFLRKLQAFCEISRKTFFTEHLQWLLL